MTLNELRRRFPGASPAFLRKNADDHDAGVCPIHPQPIERMPLDTTPSGEETRWHDADASFEIIFTVHSTHPCDWDGYDIKALQDFLIAAGIIPDDGWKTLSGRVVSRKVSTKGEEKTVIEIREIKNENYSH